MPNLVYFFLSTNDSLLHEYTRLLIQLPVERHLLLGFPSCGWDCYEHSCMCFHLDIVFSLCGWRPRNVVSGLYGKCMFRLVGNCYTAFHSVCATLPTKNEWEILLLRFLTTVGISAMALSHSNRCIAGLIIVFISVYWVSSAQFAIARWLLVSISILAFDTVSHRTWSSLIWLDWLPVSFRESSCLCLPSWGSQENRRFLM